MNTFIQSLKTHTPVLYWFGVLCLMGTVICAGLSVVTTQEVLGINAFIKPAKFFLSTGLFCWTIAWFLPLLNRPRTATVYAWMTVLVMTFELGVVVWQAAQGKLSHFNVTSATDGLLFLIMGIAITTFTLWTGYIGFLFFIVPVNSVPLSYLWGIRLGILLFVIFAFEGGLMAARLSHTVGAPDGGAGLPVTNWSVQYGDLRVAHFLGMHAIQLLPLFGYYLARRPRQVILMAVLYFLATAGLFLQALAGSPLLGVLGI